MNLIKTKKYLLLIDDKKIVRDSSWIFIDDEIIKLFPYEGHVVYKNKKKIHYIKELFHYEIIGHLPFNDSPFLEGVFLLPETKKKETKDELISNAMNQIVGLSINGSRRRFLEELYDKAIVNQFTLDDVKDGIIFGYKMALNNSTNEGSHILKKEIDLFISSIDKPINFVPEIGHTHADRAPGGFEEYYKTEKNQLGQDVLIGKYIYG